MIVRKLRLKRGWSQSQLVEMAGVTTRMKEFYESLVSYGAPAGGAQAGAQVVAGHFALVRIS